MHIRIGVLIALLLCGQAAHAQECPVPVGADPKLAAVDASVRLKFISDAIDHDIKPAVAWRWGWFGAYGFITVAQFGLLGLKQNPTGQGQLCNPDTYPYCWPTQRIVGGVQAAIAALPPLLLPLKVSLNGSGYLAKVKTAGAGEACNLVHEGELLLKEDAHDEAFNYSWVFHVVNVVYNGVVLVILGAGYHDWVGGALAGGGGFILGEIQILTAPQGLVGAWKSYQAGNVGSPPPPPKVSLSVSPTGVRGTF